MSRPIGMATPTVEELEAEIERLEVHKEQCFDRMRTMQKEIERLQIGLDACAVDNEQYEQANNALNAEIERLRDALEKSNNMIVEFIQMADQPLEYRLNTVKRAQVLLDAIAREALREVE